MTEIHDRLDRLEALVERHRDRLDAHDASLEAAREHLDGYDPANDDEGNSGRGGRLVQSAVRAGGPLALFGVAVGTAAADPQGQVGTEDQPVQAVYAAALAGPVTGGQTVTSLVGNGLEIEDGTLKLAGGD